MTAGNPRYGGRAVPQVSKREFERLPLRVHDFLAGVALHDVWAVDLPRWRAGVTFDMGGSSVGMANRLHLRAKASPLA